MRRFDQDSMDPFNLYPVRKKNVHHISEFYGILTIIAILIIGILTRHNYRENLPKALGNSDLLHQPNSFIAERAWKDLKILTSFGPRTTGSYSNEVLAVDFLKRELQYIAKMANKNQHIEVDVQIATGAYWAAFKPHPMTNVYRNVQNVVAKLQGQTNHTLMLNCHFDSVAGSPGASDDAASCCVMLEILRVLSRQSTVNRHSIIFLFNGAEETPLQASHGFITQHKWAKNVRAFLNLESVGSAGKELLFQSDPKHSWLIKLYGKAALYPNAQSAAEEVFQSGLIPSDTDFRIFRDFGRIPGLDFAHVINGYRYHTKFDHIDYIPRNVIQSTGDNILELTKLIVNSEELASTNTHSKGEEVFFDVLGFYFISYSKGFANYLNYGAVSLSVILPYFFLSRATKGINRKHLRFEIILGFFINVLCFVCANAVSYAIAYDLDLNGRSMSWFSNTILAVSTYCIATILVQCLVHLLLSGDNKAPMSLALKAQARINGSSLFWGLLTAAITLAGYRIGYVLLIPLVITLLTNIVTGILGYQNTILKWLYVHIIGQVFVVLWTTHFYHLVVETFIPIAGRSGGSKNPDILVGIICCSLTFFITSYLTPLVILLKHCKNLIITLITVYVVSRFYIIAFSHYGFPYTENALAPVVQRHFITHTSRTLYDRDGNIRYTDSGFWFMELDRNTHKTIESLAMPDTPIQQEENILCNNEIFCGLPYYSSRQLHTSGFWLPGPSPLIRDIAVLKLTSRTKISPTIHRLNFMLTGSYLISLQIRPKDSVALLKWNILNSVPHKNLYKNQRAYFVMITHGLEATPMNITLDFKTDTEDHSRSLVDISLVTFHREYHKEHIPTFANLLAKLPEWAYAVPSVASLTSWSY